MVLIFSDLHTCDIRDEPLLECITRFSLGAILRHCNLVDIARQGKISRYLIQLVIYTLYNARKVSKSLLVLLIIELVW